MACGSKESTPRPAKRGVRLVYRLDSDALATAPRSTRERALEQAIRVVYHPHRNTPQVEVSFDAEGARRLRELTERNVGRRLAILLDGVIASTPVIRGPITGGKSIITLGASNRDALLREAQDLVAVFRTGSMPAPLRAIATQRIGSK